MATGIYGRFARLYAAGPYPNYSRRMAELLPAALSKIGVEPRTLLDVACGEGTFAIAMARAGLEVTGLDLSPDMLAIAGRRAQAAQVGMEASGEAGAAAPNIKFFQADMRCFVLPEQFDVATCWYDSLNYLLEPEDLAAAFASISRALKPGGAFIFDMNTAYGLAVMWRSQPFYVVQNTADQFDVHINSFDFEKSVATKRIVGFVREGSSWTRIDEEHRERAYPLGLISTALEKAGFTKIACWSSLEHMVEPGPDAGRVWFVAMKP